jgi:hypothetical protein
MDQRHGAAAGDDAHPDARFHEHADAQTVTNMKHLGFLAVVVVYHLAGGEDAVHIQKDQRYLFQAVVSHGMNGQAASAALMAFS